MECWSRCVASIGRGSSRINREARTRRNSSSASKRAAAAAVLLLACATPGTTPLVPDPPPVAPDAAIDRLHELLANGCLQPTGDPFVEFQHEIENYFVGIEDLRGDVKLRGGTVERAPWWRFWAR